MSVRSSYSQSSFLVYQRVAAVFLFVLGLAAWAGLIGLSMGGSWRFDLAQQNVRVFEVPLAVAYPIAATGLWFGVAWGAVLWVICAALQIGAQSGNAEVFSGSQLVVVLHIFGLGGYLAFKIYHVFIRRH